MGDDRSSVGPLKLPEGVAPSFDTGGAPICEPSCPNYQGSWCAKAQRASWQGHVCRPAASFAFSKLDEVRSILRRALPLIDELCPDASSAP